MFRIIINLLIILVASLFVSQHYFLPGIPGTDDGIWVPVRLSSMHREILLGHFPVRWSGHLNYGYGYPLFQFSYPGVYYLGYIMMRLHLGLLFSTKLIFVLGVISAAFGSYFLAKSTTRSQSLALTAALLYCASPYLFTNLYRRGSIGEITAAGVLPWVLLTTYLIIKNKIFLLPLNAILIAMLVLFHNVSALLSLPAIFIFIIWQAWGYTGIAKSWVYKCHLLFVHSFRATLGILLGLAMSSFFWLPAMHDVQYTKIAGHNLTNISEWFASPGKTLFYPFFSDLPYNDPNDYRLSLGLVQTIMLTIFLIVQLKNKNKSNWLWYGTICTYIFMLFAISQYVWKILPIFNQIDFPWRILAPLSIFLPFTFAYFAQKHKVLKTTFILGTLIATIIAVPWVKYRDIVTWPEHEYTTNQATATANNEYISKWSPREAMINAPNKIRVMEGNLTQIQTIKESTTDRQYDLIATQDTKIQYQLMYFPPWRLLLDGEPLPFNYQNDGLFNANIPAGIHRLQVVYPRTFLVIITETLSLLTLLGCVTLMIKSTLKL